MRDRNVDIIVTATAIVIIVAVLGFVVMKYTYEDMFYQVYVMNNGYVN